MQVVIAPVEDERARAAAYALRTEVFVHEQAVPPDLELDEFDDDADHVLALVDGQPVATGRLVIEPPGYAGVDPALGPVAHLGRICVRAEQRGRGLGAAVVRALEEQAAAEGLQVACLGSQTRAVPFYEGLGYAAHGPEFDDAGIPHRHMSRRLP
jgi:predicted GNAT family N-acyltransferase